MAKLTAAKRNSLPTKDFALPKERKFPVNDKNHARNALARASEEKNKGKLNRSEESKIDRAADRVLGKTKRK